MDTVPAESDLERSQGRLAPPWGPLCSQAYSPRQRQRQALAVRPWQLAAVGGEGGKAGQ